jgi:putative DNA primase/helicase
MSAAIPAYILEANAALAAPITKSASQKPKRPMKATANEYSDVFNAQRFAGTFSGRLIYVPQRGNWHEFDGVIWKADELRFVTQHAIDTTREMLIDAAQILLDASKQRDPVQRNAQTQRAEALSKHARASQQKSRLDAMVALAATDPRLAVSQAQLDADDMAFAVENGVIDLESGDFREAEPGDWLSKKGGMAYAGGWESIDCKIWTRFLEDVQPDPDIRAWLQRFAGYCLTGRTDEQIFSVMHGSGANGKTVFVETLKRIVGSYATTAQFDTFMERKGEGIRNDLAALDKVRLVVASEGPEGARLDEGIVKQITGGDEITARFLHREFFIFRPRFKVVLVTNHKPVISGSDNGIWRRVVLVPWAVTIPAGQRDRRLLDKLDAERAGILAWCLKGLADYLACGLDLPPALVKANAEYRKDSDIVGNWIEDCCTFSSFYVTASADLYMSYQQWAEQNGHRAMSSKSLANRLSDRGIEQGRTNTGAKGRIGIQIR